jgi:hypothetical protein
MIRSAGYILCFITFALHSINAQNSPFQVAPGLSITDGSVPWALETFQGKQQLVPIHHSTIEVNRHTGANVAGSLAGSFFYKPKMTTELSTPHARTQLHSTVPVFYLQYQQDSDNSGDSAKSATLTWAIVAATSVKDHRIFAATRYTQLTGNAKRQDGVIDAEVVDLSGGWYKITPKKALDQGEYAITPIFKGQNLFAAVIYDFGIDPSAANPKDTVVASQ